MFSAITKVLRTLYSGVELTSVHKIEIVTYLRLQQFQYIDVTRLSSKYKTLNGVGNVMDYLTLIKNKV